MPAGMAEHENPAPMLRLARSVVAEEAAGRKDATAGEEHAVAASAAGGQEIALPYLGEMEHLFGCSFAHVKARVDPEATAAVNARAYTFGSQVVFATPTPDKDLVLHEMTHVMQQSAGRAGTVASDEAEAQSVAAGAAPQRGEAGHAQQAELRKDAAKPATGEVLTDARKKSAITYNNAHWKDLHRKEILTKLRGGVASDVFEEPDVVKVADLQEKEGVPAAEIDGKLGPGTMAFLLRNGLKLTMTEARADQVRLVFYPGEFEDLKAWQANREKAGKQGQEDEHRAVEAPPGHGVIYVELNGNVVDRMEARGGPPFTMKDGRDHTSDPSKAGTYKLGKGKSVVTKSWANSQIAWGAPIREHDGAIQFKNPGEGWKFATGPKRQIGEIDESQFYEGGMVGGTLIKEWRQNDFGETGFRIEGSPGLYIHTSPDTEEQARVVGPELALDHSHGCLHVQPNKRNELMKNGYLQKGVTLVIKKYDQSLDPHATNRK